MVGGVPQVKVVVMNGAGSEIFGTRFFEQGEQVVGIEFFGFPERDEIGIAEFGGMSVCFEVMAIIVFIFYVELAGIPFATFGNRIGTPVEINTELGISEPFRRLIVLERFHATCKGGSLFGIYLLKKHDDYE